VHCSGEVRRGGGNRSALIWRFPWLLRLVFAALSGYIVIGAVGLDVSVDVAASAEVRGNGGGSFRASGSVRLSISGAQPASGATATASIMRRSRIVAWRRGVTHYAVRASSHPLGDHRAVGGGVLA
jgi:hypothetical protein